MTATQSRLFKNPLVSESEHRAVVVNAAKLTYPDLLITTRSPKDKEACLLSFESPGTLKTCLPHPDCVNTPTSTTTSTSTSPTTYTIELDLVPTLDPSTTPYIQSPVSGLPAHPTPISSLKPLARVSRPPTAHARPITIDTHNGDTGNEFEASPHPLELISKLGEQVVKIGSMHRNMISEKTNIKGLNDVTSTLVDSGSMLRLLGDMNAFLKSTVSVCVELQARIEGEMGRYRQGIGSGDVVQGGEQKHEQEREREPAASAQVHGPTVTLVSEDAEYFDSPQSTTSTCVSLCTDSGSFESPMAKTHSALQSVDEQPQHAQEKWESWPWLGNYSYNPPPFTNYDDVCNRRPAHVAVSNDVDTLNREVHCHGGYGYEYDLALGSSALFGPAFEFQTTYTGTVGYIGQTHLSVAGMGMEVPRDSQAGLQSYHADFPLPIVCPKPSPIIPVKALEALIHSDHGYYDSYISPPKIIPVETETQNKAQGQSEWSPSGTFYLPVRQHKVQSSSGFGMPPPPYSSLTSTGLVYPASTYMVGRWDAPSPSALPLPFDDIEDGLIF